MKSGICPKCSSHEVWCKTNLGHRSALLVTMFTSLRLMDYVCTDCGYVESYIRSGDLEEVKQTIRAKYSRVKP